MTDLSPLDALAQIAAQHLKASDGNCLSCSSSAWPCYTRRVLDAVDPTSRWTVEREVGNQSKLGPGAHRTVVTWRGPWQPA